MVNGQSLRLKTLEIKHVNCALQLNGVSPLVESCAECSGPSSICVKLDHSAINEHEGKWWRDSNRSLCSFWKHLEGLLFGEFVNDSNLGIGSRKIEWPLRRHTSQRLGKLVINRKLLDKCFIFPVRMFLGNISVVAEWFWDVADMGVGSCTGESWCHWVSDIISGPPSAPGWYPLPLWLVPFWQSLSAPTTASRSLQM